jgi:hypothetical protein
MRLVEENEILLKSNGMPTLQVEIDPTAIAVETDEDTLRVMLADGREIAVPLAGFPGFGTQLLNSLLTGG